ncbi:MAG: HXXEE domain-containing protein [Microgenomates group bacterium]
MSLLEQFFVISLLVQIAHSIEELSTGFHKKWYVFKMPFWVFLVFEIIFESFWIAVWLLQDFPSRTILQAFFLALMFANGVQHIVWAGNVKKYVPGLITAPIHIIVFLAYYFKAIF